MMNKVKNIKIRIAVMVVVCFAAAVCPPRSDGATGPGTAGMLILKQPMGPRATALGDAFVAIADDVNALQFNPGGMVYSESIEITGVMMRKYLSMMDYKYVGFLSSDKKEEKPELSIEEQAEVITSERLNKLKKSLLSIMTREELIQYTKEQISEEKESIKNQQRREEVQQKKIEKTPEYVPPKEELRYAYGAGLLDFDAGGLRVEYLDGTHTDIISAQHDYVLTFGAALGTDMFGVGANLKYFNSFLMDDFHSVGFAIDVGGIFNVPEPPGGGLPIRFGGCIQNIGYMTGYSEGSSDLVPITSRIGMSTKFNVMKLIEVNMDIVPTVELVRPVDVHAELHAGCEFSTELRKYSGDKLMIRIGYKSGLDIKDTFVAGVGLRLVNFNVDAAYTPSAFAGQEALESSLVIAITTRF